MMKSYTLIAALLAFVSQNLEAQIITHDIPESIIENGSVSIDQSHFTVFYGVNPVESGQHIGQTFTATENGDVTTISLHGTYSIWASGEITCNVYDAPGGNLIAGSPDFSDIKSVDGHFFSFSNFKTEKGKSYYIAFGLNYLGHLLYHHEGEIYDGGTAFYNGTQVGSDIPFSVVYDNTAFEQNAIAGCTDEAAINYNENAMHDDGTCFFDCMPPTAIFTSEPCENGIFSIDIEVYDLGNGGPYLISNSINDETIAVDFPGKYTMSGFDAATDVTFGFKSAVSSACTLQSEPFGCTLGIEETEDIRLSMSPNPAQNSVFIQSDRNLLAVVMVVDLTGKIMLTSSGMILPGAGMELNTKLLPTGAYLVNVQAGEYSVTKRLLISK